MTIAPWPRGELRFLKLGSVLADFLKVNTVKLLSEVNCEFCAVDWN